VAELGQNWSGPPWVSDGEAYDQRDTNSENGHVPRGDCTVLSLGRKSQQEKKKAKHKNEVALALFRNNPSNAEKR